MKTLLRRVVPFEEGLKLCFQSASQTDTANGQLTFTKMERPNSVLLVGNRLNFVKTTGNSATVILTAKRFTVLNIFAEQSLVEQIVRLVLNVGVEHFATQVRVPVKYGWKMEKNARIDSICAIHQLLVLK